MLPDENDPKLKSAAEFLRQRVRDLDKLTAEVSSIFFGVNVSCARCHDHPLVADWKQDHFFGMKSFFSRTYESAGRLAERETGLVKFKTTKGVERQAHLMFLTGKVVETRHLEGNARGGEAKKGKKTTAKTATAADAAEIQRPRRTGEIVAGAGPARFLRSLHRQSPLASLFRLWTGHAARSDALGEPAQPSRIARLAGPRSGRASVRPAPADSRPGPEPRLRGATAVGTRESSPRRRCSPWLASGR